MESIDPKKERLEKLQSIVVDLNASLTNLCREVQNLENFLEEEIKIWEKGN